MTKDKPCAVCKAAPRRAGHRTCGGQACLSALLKRARRKAAEGTPHKWLFAKDKYPQHARLRAVQDKTQFTADFFEYLGERGIWLYTKDGVGIGTGERDDLLYKFINVDRWRLEDEKRAMLNQPATPKPRRAPASPPVQVRRCKCGFKPGRVKGADGCTYTRQWMRGDSSLKCPQCGVTVYNHV